MSKSIDDYRNIIKILKLQLLKLREQNASISHSLGIADHNQSSSFTPKITKYSQSAQPFAKNLLAFLNFAHKCQLIGLTPQMVFRVADKKRDKKVAVASFGQILKRLKLRLSDVQINQLTNLITRDSQILYEEYLKCLSAFQINSQKYPPREGSRTYVQLCLLKFGKQAQKYQNADKLYKQINTGQDQAHINFDNFAAFAKRNLPNLSGFQIVAVFVGLDLNSECQIEKSIFRREMGKVYSMIEGGVNINQQLEAMRNTDIGKSPQGKGSDGKKPGKKPAQYKQPNAAMPAQESEDDFNKLTEQTGDQAAAKKPAKKPVKQEIKGSKLAKGDSAQVINQMKKLGVQINSFIQRLLSQQKKDVMVRSFTLHDFTQAIKAINSSAPKKKLIDMFKALDTQRNGTLDTAELLYIWLRAKDISDSDTMLYRLLYRHLRESQFIEPLQKFAVLGIKPQQKLTEGMFSDVFQGLNIDKDTTNHIISTYLRETSVQNFAGLLKAQGKSASGKKFVKMDKKVYQSFKEEIKKINSKRKVNKPNWPKLMRVPDQQKSQTEEYWSTIFTDEWACWQYCLETAYKLQTFWRDQQFGPTKGDPAGIRSIIGNQSNKPPGLPCQDDIVWKSYEEILGQNRSNEPVKFMQGDLSANDVVQGKLGDCWYVSALSIIANDPQYIRGSEAAKCRKSQEHITYGVNPLLFKFFIKYGIYVFKYYKKFQPVFVLVDDLFPVQNSSNQLIFAKSPNVGLQWVAFLEKSYAKLHHTYSSMISGDISQGLNDLTQAMPIKQSLPQSMHKMKILNDQRQLMGCSITAPKTGGVESPVTIDDEKCGLFYGHAYSITEYMDLKTKDDTFHLMRVRNPWGHGEWILDWSDKPYMDNADYKSLYTYKQNLKEHYKQLAEISKKTGKVCPLPYQIGKDDGQFIMKFEDFNKIFTNLFTGYQFQRKYQCQFIRETWDQACPGGLGGLKKLQSTDQKAQVNFVKVNHQYVMQVQQNDTDILMYIIQQDGRLYRGEKYPYSQLCNGILLFSFNLDQRGWNQLKNYDFELLTQKALKFQVRRQVNIWQRFQKGKYAIIPCKMENNIEKSDFQFRVYFDKNVKIKKVKGPNNQFQTLPEAKSRDIDNSNYNTFLDLLQKNK